MLGELAALAAAMLWTTSAVLYRRVGGSAPPLQLNFYKGVFACVLFAALLALQGQLVIDAEASGILLLLLSGLIGIGIGDTAFFAALNRLGERRTILISETLAPPFAAAIAWVALAEHLSLLSCFGIAVTLAGVAWVVAQRPAGPKDSVRQEPAATKTCLALALLAALCQAVGAVMSRQALQESDMGAAWASLLRLLGGSAILIVWIPAQRQSFLPQSMRRGRVWAAILAGAVIGTFMGIGCQQISLQFTPAGITQTLIATSAIFILPYVAIQGQPVSPRAIAGALVAVVGIAILMLGA